jgi:hypothetical protein
MSGGKPFPTCVSLTSTECKVGAENLHLRFAYVKFLGQLFVTRWIGLRWVYGSSSCCLGRLKITKKDEKAPLTDALVAIGEAERDGTPDLETPSAS